MQGEHNMNVSVRYISRSGNTKKVADAIAEAVGTEALDCSEPITEPVDLLFLGGAVYGFEIDKSMTAFIDSLDAASVKTAAVFGTAAIVKSGNRKMVSLLKKKGILVISEDFYCRGEFSKMHKGRPNAEDLEQAARFAEKAMSGLNI